MQPRDKVLDAALKSLSSFGPLHDAGTQLAKQVEFDDSGVEYSAAHSQTAVPLAKDVDAELKIKEQELKAREEKIREDEARNRTKKEQLRQETERLEREQQETEARRIKQQQEDFARAKRQKIDAYLKEARFFKRAGRNNKDAYDAAIEQFRSALDAHNAGHIIDLRDQDAIEIFLEVVDCYMLKNDYIAAFKELNKLKAFENIFNPLPSQAKHLLDDCETKILKLCEGYIVDLKRCLDTDKDTLKAKQYLAKIKETYGAIKYSDDGKTISFLSKAIEWQELRNKSNQAAAFAITNAQTIDSFSYEAEFEALINSLETYYIKFGDYHAHLDETETTTCKRLGLVLDKAKAKFNNFKLKKSWDLSRAHINTLFDKYSDLTAKGAYTDYNYHTVMQELNACKSAYAKHIDFLSDDERGYRLQLPALIDFANDKLGQQIIREKREEDRQRNLRSEQAIKQDFATIQQQIRQGDLPSAFDLLEKIQTKARSINYPEDIIDTSILAPNYFTASLQMLETANKHFEMRAKNNASSFATAIIEVALKRNTLDLQPTLWEADKESVTEALTKAFTKNWAKFDRRLLHASDALYSRLGSEISNNLIGNSFFTKWSPNYWTNADMRLSETSKVCDELRSILNAYQPSAYPEYIELPIFAGESFLVATVVAPPTANTSVESVPVARVVF